MKLARLYEVEHENEIDLSWKKLTSLPTDLPDQITGNLYCYRNNLTSLKHCPSNVGGDFNCYYNNLTTLEHCPSATGGYFDCSDNALTSLKDVHKLVGKIGKDFSCYGNPIKSNILGLMLIFIGEKILTELGNKSDVDKILNKWKNQGRKGVLGAQRELLELGYEELAQL